MAKKILVLCTGNSARSQMGEGLFRAEGGGGFEIFSAGTKPSFVRPEAIVVMEEIGIDLSGHRSKPVDEFAGQPIHYAVTVCDNARDTCPVFPAGTERIHWSVEDPRQSRAARWSGWLHSAASAIRSMSGCERSIGIAGPVGIAP